MEKAARSRVFIFEEHPATLWGLKHFLETRGDIAIVGEAQSAGEALKLIAKLDPDVVIADIALSDHDGMQFVKEIAAGGSRKVLAFSASGTWDRIEGFMQAGGLGFVSKRCSPEELITALDAVCQGRRWISPALRKVKPATLPHGRRDGLSPREREVVTLVARGLTSRQIADQLCVSIKTIETHRYRIFRELHIQNRAQLVNYAIEHGMLGNHAG